MRASNRGNVVGVAGGREPVMDDGADRSAADRRLSRAMMPGDQQNEAIAARNRLLEAAVDRAPGSVQAHPVEIDHTVRLN